MLKYEKINDINYIYFDTIKRLSKIGDYIKILNKLKIAGEKKVVLDFSKLKGQSYSPAHVSIAGITKYYQDNFGFDISFNNSSELYMFHTETQNPMFVDNNKDLLSKNIFDRVICFKTSEDTSYISDQIISQLQNSIYCEEGVLVGLSWCINEIMDNVFNHSSAASGYIMVQVHRRKRHISVSIYDTGKGLLNTLLKSGEYNPETEKDAIILAMEKGVTGNRNIGQGNGLWGLKQIVKENKGFLSILSGRTSIIFDFENDKMKVDTNSPIISEDNMSTRIDFTLNFKKLININNALDNYIPFEKINRDVEEMTNMEGWIDFNVKNEAKEGTGTRISGRQMKFHLLNIAKYDYHPILINFANVDMITSSFADEFIGKLVLEIGFVQFCQKFRIINANDYVEPIINKAIIQRQNER